MGSWRIFCSRRDAVVILWPEPSKRRPPIGVKLMMSSSAPPPPADRACTHRFLQLTLLYRQSGSAVDDAGANVFNRFPALRMGKGQSSATGWNAPWHSSRNVRHLSRRLISVDRKVMSTYRTVISSEGQV